MWNVWNNQILPCCDTDVTAAVYLGHACDFDELPCGNPANRHRQADGGKSWLLLVVNAKMVGALAASRIPAGGQQPTANTALQLAANRVDTPIVNEKCEPCPVS